MNANIEEQLYFRREDRKKFINRIERNGFVKDYELEVRRKNGKKIIAQETTSVIKDKNDNIVGYLGIIRDITEKKELEEKLIQAQKMESIGKLAGGVVHDLNNVLSAISNYPDLILKNLPSDDSFKFIRDKLTKIKKSGLKAAAIAQDLLSIAHRGKVAMEMVDLNQLITEYFESPVFDKLKSNNTNITIKTDLDPNLFMIQGSPIHLSKIIMNLVSNAIEAIRNIGTVFITTRNECLSRNIEINGFKLKSGKYVVLQVADNGDGIEEDEIHRIFEPFYTKKEMGRSGTGLGMTIVWGTVQDHNGGIDIWTRKGQGTIFDIYLPIRSPNLLSEKYSLGNNEPKGTRGKSDC
jgi:signal transduction histidine kinase